MILKTAANYNDEGGYIEAWKNSDGTTEVKLIPKNGGDEGKNGILSVTISPAITTTPALDSLFPIYLDDLTDEEKVNGKTIAVEATYDVQTDYYVTVTPTSNWYALNPSSHEFGSVGEPVTYLLTTGEDGTSCVVGSSTDVPPAEYVSVNLVVTQGGGQ